MPSIPQSLLWISLVVLWLFVLVPMLINRRDTVRRTSDVALATRVLNTTRAARLIRRGGPAAGHRSDPHWRPEADDDFEDFDEDDTGPVVVTGKPSRVRSVAVVTALAEEDEPDYLDVDIVEENSGALPVAEEVAEPQTDELPLEFASAETEPEPSVADPPVAEEDAETQDGTADEYEYVEDTSGLEPEADEPVAPVAGREVRYATKTAAAVSARKYRFRSRALVTMAALLLLCAVLAFAWTPTAWYACATLAVATLGYLAYLRRQTRIEEQLRRRRMQRMSRARLGVENTDDRELDVVPARLRRPGAAVLEIDDEDPVFEHLEYTSFAREYDLPRASGQ
ncbi:MAG: gephyrin-like molybdotransferase receptor GlpR [Mycobacterium sp.]